MRVFFDASLLKIRLFFYVSLLTKSVFYASLLEKSAMSKIKKRSSGIFGGSCQINLQNQRHLTSFLGFFWSASPHFF